MQHLPQNAKQDFLDGAHVCHHSEGAAAVSSDQFGEQTYIKQGKQAGGLKGISTNSEQVAVWIESFSVCSHLSMAVSEMYTPSHHESSASAAKHKEEGEKRCILDEQDRRRIVNELNKHSHPLTGQSQFLYNIVNGRVVSDKDINVQNAVEIGQDLQQNFQASLPNGFHIPIKKKVKTMQSLKHSVKVKDRHIFDLQALFGRLLVVGQKRNINLSEIFQHELSPLFHHSLMNMGVSEKETSPFWSSVLVLQ